MTVNKDTGSISLPEINAFIEPSLTRSQFLQTAPFSDSSVVVRNEPWCSFRLQSIPQQDSELCIIFQFHGERLVFLSLTHGAPRFGSSWSGWSEEREFARKSFHEHWLTTELGIAPGPFTWGEIASTYGGKGGSSLITITFTDREG